MGYRLNLLDEPVFMAVPNPMLTEFGIHHGLESCAKFFRQQRGIEFLDDTAGPTSRV